MAITHQASGMAPFPSSGEHGWFSINRTLLSDGYVSETMDGKQVAPLMGDYTDNTVGTLRLRTVPNMWCHASCDHAVSTRLLPIDKTTTEVRVIWLVDSDPVLGAGIKGYSAREDICSGIAAFWEIMREANVSVYLDRIPTDDNLSDGPSRAKWDLDGTCGWAPVRARIPGALRLS